MVSSCARGDEGGIMERFANDEPVQTMRLGNSVRWMSRYLRDNTPGATWLFTVVTFNRQRFLCDDPVRAALRNAICLDRELSD